MDGSATSVSGEHLGLLLGPEPQSDALFVEGAIPLDSEYSAPISLAMLLAGIEAVQPVLSEAWRERSHTIVGLYRILTPGQDKVSERRLEFLAAGGQEQAALSNVRCCFVFVPLSASETLLRVLMRKGEHWEQIHEETLPRELPSSHLTPTFPVARLNGLERPHAAETTAPTAESFRTRDRHWVDVTIITLLLLLLAESSLLAWFVRRIPRETVNVQPLTERIGELSAAVSRLPPPAAAPVRPKTPPPNPQPANAEVSPPRVLNPLLIESRLVITEKPTMLQPSEAFQFKVNGNPAPEVVWSSEGAGSIDPFYGLYRAPDQYRGETRVKITATSWRGSQSVTFTLKGTSK
jgi:hypothetical protein